eukprot:1920402-Amphidinium_carterae.1
MVRWGSEFVRVLLQCWLGFGAELWVSQATLQDDFCWTIPTKLKCGTEIAVACQKGQKSEFDPTPNQDQFAEHGACPSAC